MSSSGAARREDVAQRAQVAVGFGDVVQHAGADHEGRTRVSSSITSDNGATMGLEIVEPVPAAECERVIDARLADVDADHPALAGT